jgi:hypothetical protein
MSSVTQVITIIFNDPAAKVDNGMHLAIALHLSKAFDVGASPPSYTKPLKLKKIYSINPVLVNCINTFLSNYRYYYYYALYYTSISNGQSDALQ